MCLISLAAVAIEEGDFTAARALFEQSLALYRGLALSAGFGSVLNNLGNLLLQQAEYETARAYLNQCAAWCESVGNRQMQGLVLNNLSAADLGQARIAEARAHGAASLRLLYDCGAVVNIPMALDQMAAVAQAHTEWERAARLLGAAAGLREAAGLAPPAGTQAAAAAARRALGDDVFRYRLRGGPGDGPGAGHRLRARLEAPGALRLKQVIISTVGRSSPRRPR